MKLLLPVILLAFSAFAQECQQSNELSTSGTAGSTIDNRNRGCQLWNLVYWVEGFSALTIRLEYSIDNSTWTATTLSLTDTPVGKGNVRIYAPYFRVALTSATGTGKVKYIVGGYKGQYGLSDIVAGGGGGGGGYATLQEEGSSLTQRDTLNFIGSMVTCADNAGSSRTDCTLVAPTVYNQTIEDEGTPVTQRANVNFTGGGVSCADSGGKTVCTISGGGASSFTDLQDFKGSIASTVLTVAGGNVQWLGDDGTEFVTAVSSGTITINDAPAGDTGTIRLAVAYNSGAPQLKCYYGTGITFDASYTVSNFVGSTCTSGNNFTEGDIPIGSVTISAGVWGTWTDGRSPVSASRYAVDSTLTKTGNVFGLNTAGSIKWGAAHTSDSHYNFCATAGASGTTYACNLSPAITTYATGAHYFFTADVANTGAATINLNSLGAKTIKKYAGGVADLAANDIRAGQIVEVVYDGTNMQLVNQLGNASSGGTPGGSSTHVQFNDSGAFGGDSGMVWDNTNKLFTVSRSSSTSFPIVRLSNTASLGTNNGSRFEACHDNSPGLNCVMLERSWTNADGGGAANWSRLFSYYSGLAATYQLVGRKDGTSNQVHIGGSANATLGFASFSDTGAPRFLNAATAGLGLVSIQGAPTELTSQTGNVAAQTLLAASHTAGMYRVCGFAAVTSAGTGSTAAWTIAWRSPASGSDLTHNLLWSSGAAETDTFSVASANEFNVCKVIRSIGTSAIVVDPGDMNTATYTTAWTVERLR